MKNTLRMTVVAAMLAGCGDLGSTSNNAPTTAPASVGTYFHEGMSWEFKQGQSPTCSPGEVLTIANAPDPTIDGSYLVTAVFPLQEGVTQVETSTGPMYEHDLGQAIATCVTAPPPACVPDGLVPGDTFATTACLGSSTATCRLVEINGTDVVSIPAWGCVYGKLVCVQSCLP